MGLGKPESKITQRMILERGVYCYPAYKRYGTDRVVCCDVCFKTGVKACIGYMNKDMCLPCAEAAATKLITLADMDRPRPAHDPLFPALPRDTRPIPMGPGGPATLMEREDYLGPTFGVSSDMERQMYK